MNTLIDRMNANARLAQSRTGRKPRKDSILHNLPPEQRTKVDRWLFDKNLTYAQVAEGCWKMFGVKVSQSSVGRYYQSFADVQRVKPVVAASVKLEPLDLDKGYQLLLERLLKLAQDAAQRVEFGIRFPEYGVDRREAREFITWMRLLIAARRERTDAAMARLERDKFEIGAAKACLSHWQSAMGNRLSAIENECTRDQPAVARRPTTGITASGLGPSKPGAGPQMVSVSRLDKTHRIPLN